MMFWKPILFLLVIGGIAAAAVETAKQPAKTVDRPTERTKSCVDGDCHAEQRKFKVLHGPTALGSCDSCHVYTDEKKHNFKLKESGAALCNFCHVEKLTGKVTHKPVADGQCLSCHNPHGGADRTVLREDTMAALCAKCHQDVTQKRLHLHGPVASGSCSACHLSHRSEFPKLLVAEGRALCVSCHEQMDKDLRVAKFIHKPVTEDCQKCHEVHASDQIMQLKQAPLALCTSCHKDVKALAESAPHKHSAVTNGAACLTCHTSHGGQLAKLMKAQPVQACMTCHDKKIEVTETAAGATTRPTTMTFVAQAPGAATPEPEKVVRTIPAMLSLVSTKLDRHGPVRDGNCSGCHTPHGGTEAKLLTKAYPESFYTPFAVEKYDLCFSCHDKQLVKDEQAKGLTNFRNGDLNLHALHVNRTTKGRTCRACHETHASEHGFHIRESVPFGKWEMPLSFKSTKTGGSCAPGCHKELAYDRENPVERPATTQPAAPAPLTGTAAVAAPVKER